MGGKPIMGIAILGFPTNVLPAEVAQKIVDGGRFAAIKRVLLWRGDIPLIRLNLFLV